MCVLHGFIVAGELLILFKNFHDWVEGYILPEVGCLATVSAHAVVAIGTNIILSFSCVTHDKSYFERLKVCYINLQEAHNNMSSLWCKKFNYPNQHYTVHISKFPHKIPNVFLITKLTIENDTNQWKLLTKLSHYTHKW